MSWPAPETRALRPTPNGNDPALNQPATVGPDEGGGALSSMLVLGDDDPVVWPRATLTPSRWAGWPDEWPVPGWTSGLQRLTDTAWGCVDLNASILSTMPPYLVGASPGLPRDWLTNPDPAKYTSWDEFAKQLFWDYQLGEAFVVATARYANGWPARFHVVEPWLVDVRGTPGNWSYYIGEQPVARDDILHVRYQSRVSDAHGHGPLEAGRNRVIAASLLCQYATNLATGGGIPNSVLTHPDELTAKQSTALQTQWIEARMSTMGLPAVLSGGVEFHTLQFSPSDMALLDLSQHNESRIAVLLGVPPFLMGLPSGGDSMTYSNVNSLFDYHWRAGLRPKAQSVMNALSGWLVPRGTTVEVNRDAYVQPDPYTRAQTWAILAGLGVVDAKQIQAIERFDSSADFVATGVM
jgi:HK97 family phage portal protein